MSLAFFEHGAERLHDIARPGMLCVFDFDGTLAPTVKDPSRACVPLGVSRRLATLSELARVAVISGRSLEDLALRLDFLPDYIVGNHGIEGVPGWEGNTAQYRSLCQEWKRILDTALADRTLFGSGIWIEDKSCSLSVHYRMARDRTETEIRLLEVFAALVPDARVVAGKAAFNLLPAHAPDKRAALLRLHELSRAPSVLYISDDPADDKLIEAGGDEWMTIRIDRTGKSNAEFHLHHRIDVEPLLDVLLRKLQQAHMPMPASDPGLRARKA